MAWCRGVGMGMGMGMGDGRWEWQWQMPSSIVAGAVLSKPAVWRHSGGTDDGNRTIANLETNQNQLGGAILGDR